MKHMSIIYLLRSTHSLTCFFLNQIITYQISPEINTHHSNAWEKNFTKLLAYRANHKTCNVPTQGSSLGRWVSKMRKQYKMYDLNKEEPSGWNDEKKNHYQRLKDAGFIFHVGQGYN